MSTHDTESGHHGHGSPFIQHHYDDAQHQFDSGKLGIWIFLAQEILFFSGLFVAYVVYRSNHPEIFAYSAKYLDTNMGALNTGILIFSSLTAAWAVRAAQLNQRKILIWCLSITIACACGFLVVKFFEYKHKIHIGAVFGTKFKPSQTPDGTDLRVKDAKGKLVVPEALDSGSTPDPIVEPPATADKPLPAGSVEVEMEPANVPLVGTLDGDDGKPGFYSQRPPPNTAMFFTIYFAMTGLHGIHVLVGIGVFIWLLIRAIKGHFSSDYFGPVDYAALYWHLVDLIWIYLFPLLYLINQH